MLLRRIPGLTTINKEAVHMPRYICSKGKITTVVPGANVLLLRIRYSNDDDALCRRLLLGNGLKHSCLDSRATQKGLPHNFHVLS